MLRDSPIPGLQSVQQGGCEPSFPYSLKAERLIGGRFESTRPSRRCHLYRHETRSSKHGSGSSLPSSYPYSFPRFLLFGRRRGHVLKNSRQSPTLTAPGRVLPPPGYRASTYVLIGSSTPSPVPAKPAIFRSRDARPQQRRDCRPLALLDHRSPGTSETLATASTRTVHHPLANGLARRSVPSHLAKAPP